MSIGDGEAKRSKRSSSTSMLRLKFLYSQQLSARRLQEGTLLLRVCGGGRISRRVEDVWWRLFSPFLLFVMAPLASDNAATLTAALTRTALSTSLHSISLRATPPHSPFFPFLFFFFSLSFTFFPPPRFILEDMCCGVSECIMQCRWILARGAM